jgi:hypothetical protein
MLNSLLNYLLKKEVSRKFREFDSLSNNTDAIYRTGKITFLLLWFVFCISLIYHTKTATGISVFLSPVAFLKILSSYIKYTQRSKPVYDSIPVTGSDRRFTLGYKVIPYRQKIKGYVNMSDEEIDVRRNYFKGRLLFWFTVFIVSSVVAIFLIY